MIFFNQVPCFINSPLEQFEVTSLVGLNAPILGYFNLTLTNLALYSVLVILFIITLHYLANNKNKLVPSKWQIALESLFASISSMVREQLGKEVYLPFIYSLFCFILTANLFGAVPYSFTITTSAIVAIGLSFTIWTAVTILGLSIHKLHFFAFFIPSGTPLALIPLLVLIEVISYVARAASLGLRLFANMLGGHTLMKILASFLYKMFGASFIIAILTIIPFVLFLGIMLLEVGVAFIQAYVFTILCCSYIKDAVELHSEDSSKKSQNNPSSSGSAVLNSNPSSIKPLSLNRNYSTKIETDKLEVAKKDLALAIDNSEPLTDPIAKQNFKDLANGFFQAEGAISASFVKYNSAKLNPYFDLSQDYSKESLNFFVLLANQLGNSVKLSVFLNDYGKVAIRLRGDGWKNFLNVFLPYFTLLHGEKYKALNVLKLAYNLQKSDLSSDKLLLVHLLYSLYTAGKGRSLSLAKKLCAGARNLNLKPNDPVDLSTYNFDKTANINLMFLIGMFLGDGYLGLSASWYKEDLLIRFKTTFIIIQKKLESNLNLITKIEDLLKSLGLPVYTQVTNSAHKNAAPNLTYHVNVMGHDNVLVLLLNILNPYCDLFYWKKPQLNTLIKFKEIWSVNLHREPFIMELIFKTIFVNSLEIRDKWLGRLTLLIRKKESLLQTGKLYLQFSTNRNTKVRVGYIVALPRYIKIPTKIFNFNKYGNQQCALEAALAHRESVIKEISKTFFPVFTILTCSYIKDAVKLHSDDKSNKAQKNTAALAQSLRGGGFNPTVNLINKIVIIKNNFFKYFYRFNYLIDFNFLFSRKMVLNFISILVLIIIFISFVVLVDLSFSDLMNYKTIIYAILYFIYLGFILFSKDKTFLSKNLYIRFLQQIILWFFISLTGNFLLDFFNISPISKINCDSDDEDDEDDEDNELNNNNNKQINDKGKNREILNVESTVEKDNKEYYEIKADNLAGPADLYRLNHKNRSAGGAIKINNLFKGARSYSTSSLNLWLRPYHKTYGMHSMLYMGDKQTLMSLKKIIETYITENESISIEKIHFEYENYYINSVKLKFLSKSKNLKNKIKKEEGILSITNKDLEIFRLKSESTDHIVLSHVDMVNSYMIEVSISKFNPDLFGNYIFYNLMFYERKPGFNTEFYLSNSIRWADEITVDDIYKEYSPLKLKLKFDFLGYTLDFYNFDLNLLLIHPSLIKTKYIKSFSTIYNEIYVDNSNLETIINKNDCRKRICKALMQVSKMKHSLSLQNRFIINNELFEIDPVFINNLGLRQLRQLRQKKDDLSDTREINFVNLLPKSIKKPNCKQDINNDMNLTMHSKDKIIKIKRLFIENKQNKTNVSYIATLDFNKENNTLKFKTFLKNKKDKYKNILFKDKLYNIPYLFLYNQFEENFDYNINKYKTDVDNLFKSYLNDNQVNLISTFCFVYNLDQTFKNKLYLLHFNHITGKIDFYLDYFSFKLIKLEKTSHNNYNSLKLFNLILVNLKNNHKNIGSALFKNKDIFGSKYKVQLSNTVLNNIYNNGEVKNTFNSSKLFKLSKSYLNNFTDNSNVSISVIDFNGKFLPLFLKDFLIIYRNKKNSKIKIDDIILNFNKLVESRYRKIKINLLH